MQITSTRTAPRLQQARPQAKETANAPSGDEVTFGSPDAGLIGMGVLSGVVGIGAPAALAMGAVKCFMNSSHIAGTGFAAAGLAVGATLGTGALMAAVMSTANGADEGFYSYLIAGGVTTAAAGVAIF
jgi:hypothetical protein